MEEHFFLFKPGKWTGTGIVSFNSSSDQLQFATDWDIKLLKDGTLSIMQVVRTEGVPDQMENIFKVSEVSESSFVICLNNRFVADVVGTGVIDPASIVWKFPPGGDVEGYEAYHLVDQDVYSFHAEYVSEEGFKTIIHGELQSVNYTNPGK